MIKELRNALYNVDKKKNMIKVLEPYAEKSKEIEFHKEELAKLERGDTESLWLEPIEHAEAAKFGFIQKHITRRKQYKEYKKSVNLRETVIAQEKKNLQERIESLENEMIEVSKKAGIQGEVYKYYDKLQSEVAEAESKKTPKDMGLTMEQAIKLLNEHGMQPILTENDKQIAANDESFSKGNEPFTDLSDFVFVHKTRFVPKNDEIRTSLDAGGMTTEKRKLDGIDYKYQVGLGRDTVHFTVNGAVTSHSNGNWNNCKYAIYMSAQDVAKQGHIINASPQDTWTKGNVPITEGSYIICPASEVQEVKQQNPGLIVIGYEGNDAMGYDQMTVSMLGYSPRPIGETHWAHEKINEKRSR